jgi:hypothetical protein
MISVPAKSRYLKKFFSNYQKNFSNYAKDKENVKIKMKNISVDERTSLSHVQDSLTWSDGTDSFI